MQQRHSEPFSVIPKWLAPSELSNQAVRLYLALANFADSKGRSFPSRKALAKEMGVKSVSTVSDAIKELEEYGAITVTPRYLENTKSRRSNYYTLVKTNPTPLDRNSGGGVDRDSGAPLDRDSGGGVDRNSGGGVDRNSGGITRPTSNETYEELVTGANAAGVGVEAVEAEIVDTEEQPEDKRTTQTLIAEWLDHRTTKPPKSLIGHLSREIKKLLDEGFDYDLVRRAVGQWHQKNLHPSVLPSILDEVQKGQNSTFADTAAERRLLAGQARDKALAANTAPTLPPVDPFQLEAQHRRRQLETGGNHV